MKKHLLWIVLPLLTACGSVEEQSFGDNPSLTAGQETAFLFGSDYITAQMFVASESNTLSNTGMTNLGADAVVKLVDGKLYILYRGYQEVSDNIQVVDPLNHFETEHQISTGTGTNPWDFVIVDNKAYIVLYDPTPEVPYDLIVLNLDTQEVEQGFSFTSYLNDDENKQARASRIERVENKLYITLQDLGSDATNTYDQNASGQLVIMSLSDHSFEVIALKGRNPGEIAYLQNRNKLLITFGAPFDWALNKNLFDDPAQIYGGVEIFSVDAEGNPIDDSIFLHDEKLGSGFGYIEQAVASGDYFYITQSNYNGGLSFTSDILRLSFDSTTEEDSEVFTIENDVRDLTFDSEGHLWVAWRIIEDSVTASGVKVYNTETGEELNSYIPTIDGSVVDGFFISAIAIGDL